MAIKPRQGETIRGGDKFLYQFSKIKVENNNSMTLYRLFTDQKTIFTYVDHNKTDKKKRSQFTL